MYGFFADLLAANYNERGNYTKKSKTDRGILHQVNGIQL